LAAPQELGDIENGFRDAWVGELLQSQTADVAVLLALFDEEFFSEGVVGFDEENAETDRAGLCGRAIAPTRGLLKGLGDDTLEGGDVELEELSEVVPKRS